MNNPSNAENDEAAFVSFLVEPTHGAEKHWCFRRRLDMVIPED